MFVTASPPRVFTRDDGRDRVAIAFWNGVLSAVAALLIGFVAAVIAGIVLVLAVHGITGHMPSANPGHPLAASIGVIFYVAGGAFAWWRLRATGRNLLRKPSGREIRVILIGVGALILIRVGLVVQLVVTHQTKHIQAGFEHFDVVTQSSTMTAVGVGLAVVAMVIVAPIVEEMVFRGLLFGALASRLGILASALITALLFGAVHGDPVLFPSLAALGFVATLAYAATGNLTVAIALHAINNSLGAVLLVTKSLHNHP
jgi:membrane protease YdiL (CAAX protease family)